jgi:hypothetical protein
MAEAEHEKPGQVVGVVEGETCAPDDDLFSGYDIQVKWLTPG